MEKKNSVVEIILFCIIIAIIGGTFLMVYLDREPKTEPLPPLKIVSEDYTEIADLINKDLILNNFYFGNGLKYSENFKFIEGCEFREVEHNDYFNSLEDIRKFAQEIYSSSRLVDFYAEYPKNKLNMFFESEGKLYVNMKYYAPKFPEYVPQSITAEQIDINVINNLYAEATIPIEGQEPIHYTMEKSNGIWKVNSMMFNELGNLHDGIFKAKGHETE